VKDYNVAHDICSRTLMLKVPSPHAKHVRIHFLEVRLAFYEPRVWDDEHYVVRDVGQDASQITGTAELLMRRNYCLRSANLVGQELSLDQRGRAFC
jgi:hypothetical protein